MSNTDKYAVLGNPIEHSMSPLLHEFFAQKTGQDLSYGRILVETGTFEKTVRDFFKNGGRGCNVTVPCKLDAYKLADSLSDYAKAAGAVNTLKVMEDGSIYGDNTDGRGLVYDLKRLSCPLADARILIIGAGGAAKGILLPILNEAPKEIVIANRTVSKAQSLSSLYPDKVKGCGFDELEGSFDLIINASSTSLSGELPPIKDEIIEKAQAVYDLMYSKTALTTFTQKALSLNVPKVSDGFGMLIGQAILSFELWRGVKPDFDSAIKKFRPC